MKNRTVSSWFICTSTVLVWLSCSSEQRPSIIQDARSEATEAVDENGIGEFASEICSPTCEERECGSNGCGGECGSCRPELEQCNEAGACVPASCESSKDCPGALVCEEDLGICVYCVGDEDCLEGEKCGSDNACHVIIACASDKECKELGMVCDKGSGMCVGCLKAEHCPTAQHCKDGFCLKDVCIGGERKCEGKLVMSCAEDGSMWSVLKMCGENQYCESGECADFMCLPSTVWCEGDVYKVCSDDGKWVKYEEDCAAKNQHCFDGSCSDTKCVPDEVFCESGTLMGICASNGMSFTTQPCPAKHYCQQKENGAECFPWVCTPLQSTCDGSIAQVCNSLGSGFEKATDCTLQDKLCSAGQCTDLYCYPSDVYCEDSNTVAFCAQDGMSATTSDCPFQHSCKSGECLVWVCVPSQPTCNGSTATTCDPLGLGPVPGGIDCSQMGKYCSGGNCTTCQPECKGKECGEDGCGGTCGICGELQECVAGACVFGGLDCDKDGAHECPELAGYKLYCNQQKHCEYASPESADWKKWDVWIWIPPGTFMMGSPDAEPGHQPNESPVHAVTFAKGFFIGKYEVTVLQYEACMDAAPEVCGEPKLGSTDGYGWGINTSEKGRGDHPQNNLNWANAKAVCTWLAPGGRLPSEAEWEYAASGPTHLNYPWGYGPEPTCFDDTAVMEGPMDGQFGCIDCPVITGTGCAGTSPVGTKLSGASWSGALDMSGNVSEWCMDGAYSYKNAPTDGSAAEGVGGLKMSRGGHYHSKWFSLRTAYRVYFDEDYLHTHNGTRCVRTE